MEVSTAVTISGQPQVFVRVYANWQPSTPPPFLEHVRLIFLPGYERPSLLLKVHYRARIQAESIPQFLRNADVAVGLNSGVHRISVWNSSPLVNWGLVSVRYSRTNGLPDSHGRDTAGKFTSAGGLPAAGRVNCSPVFQLYFK